MAFWDRVKAALRREAKDAKEVAGETKAKADAAMDRKEADLHATPEQKLAAEQAKADEVDAEFDEARRKIEGGPTPPPP